MKIGAEDTFFQPKKFITCNGRLVDFSTPKVMGILNLTPDSFYDGGKFNNEKEILKHVQDMVEAGAGIIDVGAQSTRPNATLISSDDEWDRIKSSLSKIRKEFPSVVISVDTFYSAVAEKSTGIGADMINDISGGFADEKMFTTIARLKVPYILMHMQGMPQNMQKEPHYKNVVREVTEYFHQRIHNLISLGAYDIILDPGFGFGKNTDHNFELLGKLDHFRIFERPLLVGLSRKSMVNKVLKIKADEALNGTTVLNTIALLKGAAILRVHDVKEAVETIKLVEAFKNS
jgi:dihydropteroate synthase